VLQCLIRFDKVNKKQERPTSLSQYLTVGEAAKFLGVSASTLRNWDRAGKVKAVRHPVNAYRLYRREDLEALLKRIGGKE
jgi:excisionase family DNA binding protein